MLNKNKLTKKILVWDQWYDVVEVIQPNKFQDFLRVERVDDTRLVGSGEDIAPLVSMDIIDLHNQEIGLNNKTTKAYLKEDSIKKKEELREQMKLDWLHLFSRPTGD